jgi:hypothetical protein
MQKVQESSDMTVAVSRGGTGWCPSDFNRLAPWHIGCIFALLGMGCVLPEPLDPENDTEANVPPFVISTDPVSTSLTTLTMRGDFTITAGDANQQDTLYMRFFLDYDAPPAPAGPVALAEAAPRTNPQAGDFSRPAQTVTLVCGVAVPMDNLTHQLTAVVSDRPFIDNQPPIFRAVPKDTVPAEISWTVECKQ